MLKRAFKIVMGLVVLLMAAIIVIPFLIDVNKFKEPLIHQVEDHLKVKVSLDRIELHLLPLPSLVLKDLALTSKEGVFAEKPIFKMASSSLSLDLKNILSRKISMALNLSQPIIYYRTSQSGEDSKTNFESLVVEDEKGAKSESSFLEKMEVTSIAVERGVLYQLEGHHSEESTQPLLRDLDMDIDHFSLSPHEIQTIGLKLKARVHESSQPLTLAGHLVSDPVQKQYRTDDLNLKIGPTTFVLKMAFKQEKLDYHYDVQLHAESLDFSTLSALNPEFEKNLPPEAQIKGSSILTANLSGNKTQIQTTGFLDFEKAKIIYGNYFKKGDQVPARIEWSYYGPLDTILTSGTFKGKMKWQDFFVLEKYEPENFQADFHLSGKKMVLDEMSFKLFDGSLLGKGFVDFENKSPSWQFDFKAAQIDFNSLMTVTGGFRDIVSGKGDMALALSGIGSEMKEIKQSASGDGNLSVSAGKISIVNIAKEVLGQSLVDALNLALTSSAGMGGAPKIAVPRFAMQTQETNFNSFAGGFRVENGFIQLPDTKIISESAVIGLTGKTSLDGDLDLKGNFLLSRQETDQWLGDFQGKSSLVDSEGKLMVPFTVSGALTTPLIKPDVSQWTEKLKGSVIQNLQPKIEEKLPAGIQKSTDKLKEIFH